MGRCIYNVTRKSALVMRHLESLHPESRDDDVVFVDRRLLFN